MDDLLGTCQRREAAAWQHAHDELERRQRVERHLNFWRPFGLTLLVFDLLRFVASFGWFG